MLNNKQKSDIKYLLENKKPIFIVGSQASGKTTLLTEITEMISEISINGSRLTYAVMGSPELKTLEKVQAFALEPFNADYIIHDDVLHFDETGHHFLQKLYPEVSFIFGLDEDNFEMNIPDGFTVLQVENFELKDIKNVYSGGFYVKGHPKNTIGKNITKHPSIEDCIYDTHFYVRHPEESNEYFRKRDELLHQK